MDWIQQWQSKLNKQNGVAPLVRTGGSRHTGLAALPYRNIQSSSRQSCSLCMDFRYILPCFRKKNCTNLLNKFSYYFTFSNKPCTYKAKQQNTADINRACKYSECPLCQLQIQLQEQLLTDMLSSNRCVHT